MSLMCTFGGMADIVCDMRLILSECLTFILSVTFLTNIDVIRLYSSVYIVVFLKVEQL